jgi:hypothetical protein
VSKHGSLDETRLKFFERGLSFLSHEEASFPLVLRKIGKGFSEERETVNKSSVEVGEAKESLNVL